MDTLFVIKNGFISNGVFQHSGNTVTLGNVVANTLQITVGNSVVNTSAFFAGNSTINSYLNSTTGIVQNANSAVTINATGVNIGNAGANVTISATGVKGGSWSIGNSTVSRLISNTIATLVANATATVAWFGANGNIGLGGNTTPTVLLYANGAGAGAIGALTDGANIATNLAQYNNWMVSLGGNRNFDNPTGLVPGEPVVLLIYANTFSSPTWSSAWKFTGNAAPTLSSTGGNTLDIVVGLVVNSTIISATTLLNVG